MKKMLIKCPECGKYISSHAIKCTNCGIPSSYIKIVKITKCNEICKQYKGNCKNCKEGNFHISYETEIINKKLC